MYYTYTDHKGGNFLTRNENFFALYGELGYETKKAAGGAVHGERAYPATLIFLHCRSYSWRSYDDSHRVKAKA